MKLVFKAFLYLFLALGQFPFAEAGLSSKPNKLVLLIQLGPGEIENTLIIDQNNAVQGVEGKFSGLGLHYFLASGIILDVGQLVKIRPAVLVKAVVNAPVEFDFNLAAFFVNTLWLGAGYRSGDALNFLSAIQINNQLRIGYSFDYTFTSLSSYAGGTHEFSVNYLFAFNGRKITSPRYF